jgi:hypothetical protein
VTRRGWVVVIAVLWVVSLGWLVKRVFFRTTAERLAEAALSVSPGVAFYRLDLAGHQIGFASTSVDTASTTLSVADLLLLDVPMPSGRLRIQARSKAIVSRALRLQQLDEDEIGPDAAFTARGTVTGDSTFSVTLLSGPDTQAMRVRLPHPLVIPTLLPLRLAFGGAGALKPGRTLSVPVFDPLELAERDVAITVGPESTLFVPDSASFDSTTMSWIPAHLDTVRAFRIDQVSRGLTTRAWIDAEGRLVRETGPTGLVLERSAYEIAYVNFHRRDTTRLPHPRPDNIVRATVLAAGARLPSAGPAELRVRLSGVNLSQLRLEGGRQQQLGDTLIVRREARGGPAMTAAYTLPARDPTLAPALAPALLIQSDALSLRAMARAVVGPEHDPVRAAEILTDWVFRGVHRQASTGVPNALGALNRRRGDCNEMTVLYVALARAVGLPARPAAGLLQVGGRFYYHAWPEVFLGDWVAVDPMLDQFPADAGHVRFVVNGLARHAELLRFLGRLGVDVL